MNVKKEFLAQLDSENKTRLFNIAMDRKSFTDFEKQHGDVATWNKETVKKYYKLLDWSSSDYLLSVHRVFREYALFCKEKGYPENFDAYNEITTQDIDECLNHDKEMILSRSEVISFAKSYINPVDRFIILGLFEGIGAYGRQLEELSKSMMTDIDKKEMTMHLCTGRDIPVSSILVQAAEKASNTYIYKEAYGERVISLRADCKEWIIKPGAKAVEIHDPRSRFLVLQRYMKRINRIKGLKREISPDDLLMSGRVCLMKIVMEERGISLEEFFIDAEAVQEVDKIYGIYKKRVLDSLDKRYDYFREWF